MVLTIIILSGIVGLGGAIAVGKFFFKKDTEKEERRLAAADIATELSKLGLVRFPKGFKCYSVGDYSGLYKVFKDMFVLITQGEDAILKEFKEVGTRMLEAQLKTPEGVAFIESRLAEAKAKKEVS